MSFIYAILILLYFIYMIGGSFKNLIWAYRLKDYWAFTLSLFLLLISIILLLLFSASDFYIGFN